LIAMGLTVVKSAYWEHFQHGADAGVRGVGSTAASAFEQAALAMTAVICEPAGIHPVQKVIIECEAASLEMLLVEWLNAIIYEMDVRRMLFGKFEVQIKGSRLEGKAWGEALDESRHRPIVEVKGATLASLEVRRRVDGWWIAQCVVDV